MARRKTVTARPLRRSSQVRRPASPPPLDVSLPEALNVTTRQRQRAE